MKVLLDVAVSPRLRRPLQEQLEGAVVETAVFREWRSLRDDRLLAEAARYGFTTLTAGAVERVTRSVRYRAPHREQSLPLEGPAADRSAPREPSAVPAAVPAGLEFQDLFLARLGQLTADEPCSSAAIARSLDVAPGQVNEWLQRGVADGSIHKTNKPARYRLHV